MKVIGEAFSGGGRLRLDEGFFPCYILNARYGSEKGNSPRQNRGSAKPRDISSLATSFYSSASWVRSERILAGMPKAVKVGFGFRFFVFKETAMFLNINRNKKAQLIMEYVVLVVMAILAIIAVQGISRKTRDVSMVPAECSSFDCFFRHCAAAAGGVVLP